MNEDDEMAALQHQAELELRQRYWWMDEQQITEHLKLRDELRQIMADNNGCGRWWCFKSYPHTHEPQDTDLALKQEREKVSNHVKACEIESHADTYRWP